MPCREGNAPQIHGAGRTDGDDEDHDGLAVVAADARVAAGVVARGTRVADAEDGDEVGDDAASDAARGLIAQLCVHQKKVRALGG